MRVTLNNMIICFFYFIPIWGRFPCLTHIFQRGLKPPTVFLKRSAFLCVSLFGSLRPYSISNLIPVLIFWMSGDVPMSLKTSCDKVHRINSFGHLNISNNCRWKKFCTSFFPTIYIYLKGFIHPMWLFGISSINRSTYSQKSILLFLSLPQFPMLCHFLLP